MIAKIAALIIGFILLHFNINRYLHIMQQAFYNFTDYMPTLKSTKRLSIEFGEVVLLALMCIAIFFVESIWVYIAWGAVALITLYYQIKHKPQTKKKFVITNRVKIIYSIIYILFVAAIVFGIRNKELALAIALLLISAYKHLAIIIVAISNMLAKPINNLFNLRYINDAKRILREKSDMKIVGITGSYGKTSTKNIVSAILAEEYNTVMTPKSFNTTLGVVRSIRENIRPYTDLFVCEMGAARVGEIKEICDIVKPDFSVITSIGPQHLTTFKSIENVQKGKFEIITNSKKDTVAVLNIDNEYIYNGIKKYALDKQVVTYSMDNKKADYYVENITLGEQGSNFTVKSKDEEYNVTTKLLGKHNIYNIVCAIAIAKLMNISKEKIEKAVKKLEPVEHRLELKRMQNILTLDDSFNSNPEGSKAAIECLTMFEGKYRVLVTPGMIELGEKTYELNKKLGEYATKCDYVILVGDKTTKPIKDGMDEQGYKNYEIVKDVYEAFIKLNTLKQNHNNLIALIENDLTDSYS